MRKKGIIPLSLIKITILSCKNADGKDLKLFEITKKIYNLVQKLTVIM